MPTSEQQSASGGLKTRRGRPKMKDYGISGSAEGLLPWEVVVERLSGARNYWIGTTRPDGKPHAAPVWGIVLEQTFYFSTGRQSRKNRNLTASPELVMHLESGDDVVIIEGVAEEETDPTLLKNYAEAYQAKYQYKPDPSDPAAITYALRPHVVFAWLESSFPNSATRWDFDDES